jgi:hypothetical protein
MRLMILNGPNLNLLGVREPHIYGSTTLAAVHKCCKEFAVYLGASLIFEQSNHEGVLVEMIQSARTTADAIIINRRDIPSPPSRSTTPSRRLQDLSSRCTSPTSMPATSCIATLNSRAPQRVSSAALGLTATLSPCKQPHVGWESFRRPSRRQYAMGLNDACAAAIAATTWKALRDIWIPEPSSSYAAAVSTPRYASNAAQNR